jgi:cytochrome c biogenesis protein CcmG, thiol:disulfide interchange protein DsbE
MNRKTQLGAAIWKLGAMALLMLALASPGGAQSAPDFALKDAISGKTYTLSQFRGKVVLVNFITYLCKPCREEMPELNQIDQEFRSRGYQTLGIGLDSDAGQLRALVQELGLGYPMLVGSAEVAKAFGNVEFVPCTFIIDRQGNIAQRIPEARSKADFIKLLKPLL